MNEPIAPTLGATSLCPCSLSSIRPSLQALASAAQASGGLTPTQAQAYLTLYQAWQYYRPTQPPRFQSEMDGLVDAIGDIPVVVRVA